MLNKIFSDRLNKELDNMGAPEVIPERIAVLSKLLKIPKFKAEGMLNGIIHAEDPMLKSLALELEVKLDWLLGKDVSKT